MSKTLSHKNTVILASAGSRKTTHIIEEALKIKGEKVLITTYTNENLDQIYCYLLQKNGCIPQNISILSWYSFLLQDGVRPYQNKVTHKERVRAIFFGQLPDAAKWIKKTDPDNYFLGLHNEIYRDRVADFVCFSDDASNGLVIKRLQGIYKHIFVDELQDFAGYDLTFLEKLFKSSISIIAVGDPRQATYTTNNAAKNKQYRGSQIFRWIKQQVFHDLIYLKENTDCYRSNQYICDFADALYPDFPKSLSKNIEITGHDGIFYIKQNEISDYIETYNPKILRYSKVANTMNLHAINIGISKGRTYDRVIIFPTKPMSKYIRSKNISDAGDLSKLYVAVTRAKYSVAFVI